MTSLYELTEQQLELQAMVESGDFTPAEIADTVEALGMERADKLRSYCYVIQQKKADQVMLKAEIERLSALKATAANSEARLKEALHESMRRSGETKVDLGSFKLSERRGSQSISVIDAGLLPVSCQTLTISADKAEIKRMIKAGEMVPGAKVVIGKTTLTIK